MAASVTHATTATGTDNGNGDIHKAEWNAEHIISGVALSTHTHSGSDITSGTVAEGRIDSAITRDSEAAGAYSAIGHDHDGSPESKLAQANTHESPDTDSGTSSLHHTIGTGANQAAAGNHSHGGGGISSGTSFPGSPSTGDVFFRTDRGFLYFYDGTRWLTEQLYVEPITGNPGSNPPFSAGGSQQVGRWSPCDSTYDLWIVDVVFHTFVATTNNGSNYWTVTVRKYQNDYSTSSVITTHATSGDTVNVGTNSVSSVGALFTPATYVMVQAELTKTAGAPGNMSTALAYIRFRLVG